jgi:N6-adenosine-specific RNA methylase IME4
MPAGCNCPARSNGLACIDHRRHSEKPPGIRKLVERLSPGPRLELFGRQEVEGWIVFGNETFKTKDLL